MSLLSEIAPAPRRIKPIFFVVDCSGKIGGELYKKTVLILEECIKDIIDTCPEHDDVHIKIAVLQFGGCSWVTSNENLIDAEDFFCKKEQAGNMKGLGDALLELDKKLSNEFLKADEGMYCPVIFFIGSGETSINCDYEIETIKGNKWFRHSTKIAIMTDVKSNPKLFYRITGNPEMVCDISTWEDGFQSYVIRALFHDDYVS